MRGALLAALLGGLVLGPAQALAESPRYGSFQFQIQAYRPNIDAEFHGAATPYKDVFGKKPLLIYQFQAAYSLFTGFGSLDLGGSIGWTSASGFGIFAQGPQTGQVSQDKTQLRLMPLSASLTYRFDYLADRFRVPLAPYFRVSYEYWIWWVTNGAGNTATDLVSGRKGTGSTQGWSGAVGLSFLLDVLDPTLAREMDRDLGINHTYLFAEAAHTAIDDWGSKKSWDLSNDQYIMWSGGILFVF